jgi:uncharacterized protein (TIGR02145 family)
MGTTNLSKKKSSVKVVVEQPKHKTQTPRTPQLKPAIEGQKTPTKSKAKNAETVTDADGNIYTTVKIGTQIWTVENLKTTKYRDGSPIPLASDNSEWDNRSSPAYCWYASDISNKKRYGALYNWYTVNTGKLAPKGWHVPTDTDWAELENYLITNGYNSDGTKEGNTLAQSLTDKTALKTGDASVTLDKRNTNRSGFSALPGGSRYVDGVFYYLGAYSYWWSATEGDEFHALTRYLFFGNVALIRGNSSKSYGYSVRLVED